MWKDIFLDIACFLRGKTKDQVIEILENCGFDARIGISVLLNKSLLILENKTLWMHDHYKKWVEKLSVENHMKSLESAVGCGFVKICCI